MYSFKRPFDQRKPQSRGQIISNLYGQIMLLAIGCINSGMFVVLIITDTKRGDPFGTVVSLRVGVAASLALVLGSAFWIHRSIRSLKAESRHTQ